RLRRCTRQSVTNQRKTGQFAYPSCGLTRRWEQRRDGDKVTTIMKTTRAKYPDVDGASHSREELLEKCADSERMNARDISAMIPPMLQLVGVHFQKERMAF